jgi:hypothetical protein
MFGQNADRAEATPNHDSSEQYLPARKPGSHIASYDDLPGHYSKGGVALSICPK